MIEKPIKKKKKNWAIYYDNDGYTIKGEKIMGRQGCWLVIFKSAC